MRVSRRGGRGPPGDGSIYRSPGGEEEHVSRQQLAHEDPHALTAPSARESHVTRSSRIRLEAFGNTDIGLVRTGNEDSLAVLPRLGLFLVADGMGGANAGEVASRMAIDCVREAFENTETTWPRAVEGSRPAGPDLSVLLAGIHRANALILSISRRYKDKAGMGTTFAGLLKLEDRMVIAHVGDSRVYRLRGRVLDLLTEDHSLLNECIRAGVWSPDNDPADFPHRNMISRAVGTADALEVDTRFDLPQPGDVYLICSDGLHGIVDDDRRIASVLLAHDDLTVAVERLIELAYECGGHDNVTAVLVRVTDVDAR
jgi:protein phosphatase